MGVSPRPSTPTHPFSYASGVTDLGDSPLKGCRPRSAPHTETSTTAAPGWTRHSSQPPGTGSARARHPPSATERSTPAGETGQEPPQGRRVHFSARPGTPTDYHGHEPPRRAGRRHSKRRNLGLSRNSTGGGSTRSEEPTRTRCPRPAQGRHGPQVHLSPPVKGPVTKGVSEGVPSVREMLQRLPVWCAVHRVTRGRPVVLWLDATQG